MCAGVYTISKSDELYPRVLAEMIEGQAPDNISAIGSMALLEKPDKLALFCSSECPGDLILKSFDLAKKMRQGATTIIGGFQSPVEKDFFDVYQRGSQTSSIICPARSINKMRVTPDHKKLLADNRLLILSPFTETQKRPTVQAALFRNLFAAALADAVLVVHASSNGMLNQFCNQILSWGKPLYTLESENNAHLLEQGFNIQHA
jgi:predicted Rossmann fold nucleotide-binding protein DprA/Smf involved in DNA uptake